MRADLQPVRRTIIGRPDEVAAALDTARRQGRLTHLGVARPCARGWVRVEAVLLDPVDRSGRRRPTGPIVAAVAVAVMAVIGVAGWALYTLVTWALAHLAVVLVVLALAAVVTVGVLRRGSCSGIHCGGCAR